MPMESSYLFLQPQIMLNEATDYNGIFPAKGIEFKRDNGPTLRSFIFLDQRQTARMVANRVETGIAR